MLLRPNKTRAKAAMIFLLFILITELAFIVSSYMQLNLLKSVQAGKMISDTQANQNDMRHFGIIIISMMAHLGCIITFIMWFRRAYYNLHQRVSGLAYSEGWAAGGWFVPFVNLARPVQIMSEMARETQNLLVREKLMEPKKVLGFLIPTWWTLWLIDGIIVSGFERAMTNDKAMETIEGLISETNASMYASFAGIPLVIVAIAMVRAYSRQEDLLPLVSTSPTERPIISDNDLLDA
jgi:hypothetical protein